MLKALLAATAVALVSFAVPASAQMMCGPGQQAQASGSGGMMCGMMGAAQAQPEQAKPETKKPQASGMCPCCRNMAMMRGGGMMQQHHNMPGMDMPKAQ